MIAPSATAIPEAYASIGPPRSDGSCRLTCRIDAEGTLQLAEWGLDMKVLLAAATLMLAACSSIGSVPNLPVAPAASSAATAGAAWSAEFADGFCAALREHATLETQVPLLTTALKDRDYDAVALQAAETGKTVRAVDARLKTIASLYQPARPLMVAWRKANASLIKALKEMERGARSSNRTRLERGARQLAQGAALLDKAVPLVQKFVADRPSMCS
jgi:hypothetical protein